MTGYQRYLLMPWTTEADPCEAACTSEPMGEGRYVAGELGHYCSTKCRDESELGFFEDPRHEARQMGLTAL